MSSPLRIGNAQGFWGDSMDAPARLVAQQPDLDYLTLDYLAEVSMSLLAGQRAKDPALGYARDFVDVVRSLVPHWRDGGAVKVVCNAGGLNPRACAEACATVLAEAGLHGRKIGLVTGDDVINQLKAHPETESFNHLESGAPLSEVRDQLVTANAYIGISPVISVLEQDPAIVVTGRVADPSLVAAICAHHYGWAQDDWDRIAAGTVAGHVIECGAQACGGISTAWLDLPDPANIGFPVVEVSEDGSFVVTKPDGTGGIVTEATVKEQLLYEIGDPENYLSPDARVNFCTLHVEQSGDNRVRVYNASGSAPTDTYKVSATCREGYWAQGMLTLFGRDAAEKAQRSGEIIFDRLKSVGYTYARHNIEVIGAGAIAPGILPPQSAREVVLRVSCADADKTAVERFAKEIAPLVTSGAQGTTGYAAGRPKVSPVLGYWPCLIAKTAVKLETDVLTVK